MSIADFDLVRFTLPWIGLGFVATSLLGFTFDVRGAIAAFALGAIAPTLVYLPSTAEGSLVEAVVAVFRAPVPLPFVGTGAFGALSELTIDWWSGGAFGAGLAIYARRRFRRAAPIPPPAGFRPPGAPDP